MSEFTREEAPENHEDDTSSLPVAPQPIATPSISPVPQPLTPPEDEFEEDDDTEEDEPHECRYCYYFGKLHQNPNIGLCLRKSMKSKKTERMEWVNAKNVSECKYWRSDADEFWEEFWSIAYEMPIDNLKQFIKDIEEALAERSAEEDDDIENIDPVDWLGDT